MSKRNQHRVKQIIQQGPQTVTQIRGQIPLKDRPGSHEVGAWLRSQGYPREVRRGGSSGGSVWG